MKGIKREPFCQEICAATITMTTCDKKDQNRIEQFKCIIYIFSLLFQRYFPPIFSVPIAKRGSLLYHFRYALYKYSDTVFLKIAFIVQQLAVEIPDKQYCHRKNKQCRHLFCIFQCS